MRIEKDSMGEMSVPDDALYGASTQRAVSASNRVLQYRTNEAVLRLLNAAGAREKSSSLATMYHAW